MRPQQIFDIALYKNSYKGRYYGCLNINDRHWSVAIQLANICYLKSDYEIDMVGRASTSKNQNAIKRIVKEEKQFEVKIQNEAHQHLGGKFEIKSFV